MDGKERKMVTAFWYKITYEELAFLVFLEIIELDEGLVNPW